MSAARHTPGPWTYPGGTGNLIGGPDRLRVADLGGLERSPDERQANARLISAAPDLLAACKALVREVLYLRDEGTLPAGVDNHPTMKSARAAILKAEGGAS
jgi:hypothetical protein